jgi:hypothetical protein
MYIYSGGLPQLHKWILASLSKLNINTVDQPISAEPELGTAQPKLVLVILDLNLNCL